MRINDAVFNPKSEIQNPKCRRGVTLTEVLMSMFMLAIGLMGVLALFPMGILQMRDAVKSERTAQTAKIMEGHAKYLWLIAWIDANGLRDEVTVLTQNPELVPLDNRDVPLGQEAAYLNGTLTPATQFNYQTDRNLSRASAPVYIDPIGFRFQPGGSQAWVGGLQIVPRRGMSVINNITNPSLQNAARIRLCSLQDDLTFDTTGLPATPVQRQGDFNAAYLIQRSKNNVRTEINLTVIVYQRRPPTDTFALETHIGGCQINPATREIELNLTNGIPLPKAGTWMLACGGAPGAGVEWFADFYRVIAVSPSTTTGFTHRLEVAQTGRSRAMTGGVYNGQMIQMENVAEVFDKGTLTVTDRPTQ